jgi:hypothetical protein
LRVPYLQRCGIPTYKFVYAVVAADLVASAFRRPPLGLWPWSLAQLCQFVPHPVVQLIQLLAESSQAILKRGDLLISEFDHRGLLVL